MRKRAGAQHATSAQAVSVPDGLKRMFMCKLAIGAHTAVPPDYRNKEPPVRDSHRLLGVGTLKYDTTTNDDVRDGLPEIMVAYKDNQACPEYLVTFST